MNFTEFLNGKHKINESNDDLFGKAFAATLKKWRIPSVQAIYHDAAEYGRFMDDVKKAMEKMEK